MRGVYGVSLIVALLGAAVFIPALVLSMSDALRRDAPVRTVVGYGFLLLLALLIDAAAVAAIGRV